MEEVEGGDLRHGKHNNTKKANKIEARDRKKNNYNNSDIMASYNGIC